MLTCVSVCVMYKKKFTIMIEHFLLWTKSHPYAGPFLISLLILVVVVAILPYSIIAVGAGWTFQQTFQNKAVAISVGTATVFMGAWLGALVAFVLGRYLVRD